MRKIIGAARFWAEQTGATMVEYGIMLALIAAVCIAALVPLGNEVKDVFEDVGEMMEQLLGG